MSYEDDCNEYYFGIPFKKRMPAAAVEPKFKVGDRVLANGNFSFDPSTGTVVEDGGSYYRVHIDATTHGYGHDVWNYLHDELTLAPTIVTGNRVIEVGAGLGPHAMGDEGKVRELITKVGFVNAGVEIDPWGVYTVFPVEVLEVAVGCPQDNVQQDNVIKIELDTSALDEAIGKLRTLTAPCIVARVLDGQPRPSNIPFVHASSAEALTEAERLATNNPGQEFAVYQRVAARVCEVHLEMKEVA